VAKKMGLDTSSPTTLWKDRAVLELNAAVLHSFQVINDKNESELMGNNDQKIFVEKETRRDHR